jgi:hypothetical protein
MTSRQRQWALGSVAAALVGLGAVVLISTAPLVSQHIPDTPSSQELLEMGTGMPAARNTAGQKTTLE